MDADRGALIEANPPPRVLRLGLAVLPAVFLALFYVWPLGTLLARVLNTSAIADTVREGA